jgi:pilus assembly protein CpaE
MLAYVVQSDSVADKLAVIKQLLAKLNCDVHAVDSIEAAMNGPNPRSSSKSLVVVPETGDGKRDILEITRHAARAAGHAVVLYIAQRISPEDYKSLLRLGWADSTDWDSAVREVNLLVERLQNGDAPGANASSQPSQHRVTCFVGTGGGPGNTTIAMETGIHLASLKGREAGRVALFDLNLESSIVCDYLDLAPRMDWAEVAKNPERIDDHMLGLLAARHGSGLDVFASSPSTETVVVNQIAILTLLNRLIESYDFVIIDVPAHRRNEVDEILQNSDSVVVTGLFSVPSVRQLHRIMQQLKALKIPSGRVAAVITDAEKNLLGMVNQRFDVRKILTDTQLFYVRRDRSFAMQCVDSGTSMLQAQQNRGVCQDIAKIAEYVRTIEPATALLTSK